ncbi:Pentatricopeptide repeat [Dillenia turbinata]|uniref:Pentatricopeptide repeat n=1 Tax=Dillenia turbinata TaxID=194707 RepID=A0AAN8VDI3_9MAGN
MLAKNLSLGHLDLLLQRCMKLKALKPGKQIHAILVALGMDTNQMSMNSKLVGMYASCGDLENARSVFDNIQTPSIFAFNWMILSYAFHGFCEKAIGYFTLIEKFRIYPNKFTFSCVLKACVGLMDLCKGKEIHGVIYKMGFEDDACVGNALVDMYAKCGQVGIARKVFDKMIVRDVATWTSMICGYLNFGILEEAVNLFERMTLVGVERNEFTWNAMIAGHARQGDCDGAFKFLARMKREGFVPDLVTWNASISGFAQSGRSKEALKLFKAMLSAGVVPNNVTIAGLLPACGSKGSIKRGKEIHGFMYRIGLDVNLHLGSALIDMYCECGCVKCAWNVFSRMLVKNITTWNAMIGCYGKHGMVESSIRLFERMQKVGIHPNEVTFVSILSACSHGGFVEEGIKIFKMMKKDYTVKLCKEHYNCVIDLLSRSGMMDEAYHLLKENKLELNDSIVGAFLNGCKLHGRGDLAKSMADDFLRLKMSEPASFVTLSNIYANGGEWDVVESTRNVMKKKGVHKMPGSSWVEKGDGYVDTIIH